MKIFKQLFIILAINFAGELISETLSVPLPGSIIGMLILLALLLLGIVKEEHIAETSTFLLDNMPFFFIPAGVSVMVSYQFLEGHLAATVSTIVLSTIFVMVVTSLATQFLIKSKKND
nr:CidA/LrgA family protein [uncultured Carboxylicivirga sp.]